uniref:Integrase, catalytic region, zinc finger, CCHC-type, peptidase aspartic, catalytic n=1 Tax=Tanacetum cinerariifolium TaxID=118510 RepID=A0A699HRD4_TANCI|nr:integrase, catalytic region, zinc finger, CCHC-type, peptidase aspartic, catalytic [Tanacetum cinerariifolium]
MPILFWIIIACIRVAEAIKFKALPPEWSKFVTDVKLEKSLYTTNYDQLYTYLSQHERHANEKLMLVEAQEAGQILDEEKLAFIANLGIAKTSVAQQTIPQNSAFQTEDLDAYDSDCNDISSAKAVLMTNISSCDLDILFEVPYSDTYPNDMINPDV